MKLILIIPKIYYYVIIDFIIGFFLLRNGYNTLLIVIYKFSKKVTTVSGKNI